MNSTEVECILSKIRAGDLLVGLGRRNHCLNQLVLESSSPTVMYTESEGVVQVKMALITLNAHNCEVIHDVA